MSTQPGKSSKPSKLNKITNTAAIGGVIVYSATVLALESVVPPEVSIGVTGVAAVVVVDKIRKINSKP